MYAGPISIELMSIGSASRASASRAAFNSVSSGWPVTESARQVESARRNASQRVSSPSAVTTTCTSPQRMATASPGAYSPPRMSPAIPVDVVPFGRPATRALAGAIDQLGHIQPIGGVSAS